MDPDLRARTRDVLRAELADAILRVFLERGYAVTVEEAANAVGISRATFFRYFASKEDVVVAAVERREPDYAAALSGVNPRGRTLWELARLAVAPVVADAVADPQLRRERLRLIGSQPALRARFTERRQRLVAALKGALAQVSGAPDHQALVVASAAMAALDVAWHEWAKADEVDLADAVDAAFGALGRAGEPLP